MRRGFLTPAFWTALTLAVGLLAWLPAPAQAVPIACTEAALRGAVADGATIDIPDLCTITLSPGVADENSNVSGDVDLYGINITIQGAGPGRTVIDGGANDRVFDIGFSGAATVTIKNMTIRNGDATTNTATKTGGCIYVAGGMTLVLENVILENCKGTDGGGLYENDATLTLTNVAVLGNQATTNDGGGLFLKGPVTITNSTISGNTAATAGGGIFHPTGNLTLTNVTIAFNTAGTGGGGLNLAASTTAKNTIIANNTSSGAGPDCICTFNSDSANNLLSNSTTCTLPAGQGNKNDEDPLLLPLANNGGPTATHALLPGSPAIDAGNATACPSTDQRGTARTASTCDIGAFELVPSTLAISLNDGSYDAGDTLSVDAVLFNAGAAVTVDAYLGFFLADGMIPGCAAVPLAFVDSSGGLVLLCGATTPAGDFPKFVAGVTIPTMATPSVLTGVFSATIPAAPLGVIEAFAALTPAGALDDDAIGPADVLAFSLVEFAVPAP